MLYVAAFATSEYFIATVISEYLSSHTTNLDQVHICWSWVVGLLCHYQQPQALINSLDYEFEM